MPYFTKKELVMSLCCPVITALWGLYHVLTDLPLVGLAAVLIGGVLPIVLTLRFKIRTDSYLLIRLIVIAVVFGLNKLFENFVFLGSTNVTFFAEHMLVTVAAVLLQILMFKRMDGITKGERAVLILSDSILWWAVYYIVYYIRLFAYFGF